MQINASRPMMPIPRDIVQGFTLSAHHQRGRRLVRLVSFSSAGHRAAYDLVLTRLLKQHDIDLLPEAKAANVDLFPMLDDNIAAFIRTALINAFRNRHTVGLFFRPGEALKRTKWRYVIKYVLFRMLKHIPGTRILTIMPFDIEHSFSNVAHGWIYDPQLWDLSTLQPSLGLERTKIAESLRKEAAGRQIIVALGGQDRGKGFDYYVRLYSADPRIRERFFCVAAGKVANDCTEFAQDFIKAGGKLIDRFVSDEELYGLYDPADFVWSCYAPSYDQASGIFGRAFQLGRTSIVRRSSYMHMLGENLGIPMVVLDPKETLDVSVNHLMDLFLQNDTMRAQDNEALYKAIIEMREKSAATLIASLGIST